ncbi:Uncharacterized protein Rs2_35656 [Raphanus sativus]|nr:Uncharacterized protein Rs2_35656 [Raphanus sativus]
MGARKSNENVDTRGDFFARLTRMAILFGSLITARKRDMDLAGLEGSLSELQLLRGPEAPSLDSEGLRLNSRCPEVRVYPFAGLGGLRRSGPCHGEVGVDEVGSGGATKGGDGETVPASDEFGDECDAPGASRFINPLRDFYFACVSAVMRP